MIGKSFRLLDQYGGAEGQSTIRLVAANEATVTELSQADLDKKCKGTNQTGCNDGSDIFVLSGQSMVDNASRLTHEATHFFDKGAAEEPLAWRSTLRVWNRFDSALPTSYTAGSWYRQHSQRCARGAYASNYCP